MLSQWLRIMVPYAEPVAVKHGLAYYAVVVSHGELCCARGVNRVVVSYGVPFRDISCKSYEPVVVNNGVLYWAGGCESWCELWYAMLNLWLWSMVCYADQVIVSHGEICGASSCDSCCVILSQWLWIMVCHAEQLLWIMVFHAEQVVVSHGELSWASGCESCCVTMGQWLLIIVCYSAPVVVNHVVSCWANVCESWCAILSQWLLIMVYYAEQEVVNYAVLYLWIMVSYTEPVAVNDGFLCCANGCDSLWVKLC